MGPSRSPARPRKSFKTPWTPSGEAWASGPLWRRSSRGHWAAFLIRIPWTPRVFSEFVQAIGSSQTTVLAWLVRHTRATDATLRQTVGVASNKQLAGILSGLSKQAAASHLSAREVFTIENESKAGETTKTYVIAIFVDRPAGLATRLALSHVTPWQMFPGVTPWPRNAPHPFQEADGRRSIRQFGFTVPVLIDEAGRRPWARGRGDSGWLSPAHALKRGAEARLCACRQQTGAGWDEDLLATEFCWPRISTYGIGVELASRFQRSTPSWRPSPPRSLAFPPGRGLATRGAPAPVAIVLATLMAGDRPAVFTDPPYNVPIAACRRLGPHHAPRAMAAGEMSPEGSCAGPRAAGRDSVEGSICMVATCPRSSRRARPLHGTQEPRRLGQGQRLAWAPSIVRATSSSSSSSTGPPRTATPSNWANMPLPHERAGVPWCQHETAGPDGRPGAAPDGRCN